MTTPSVQWRYEGSEPPKFFSATYDGGDWWTQFRSEVLAVVNSGIATDVKIHRTDGDAEYTFKYPPGHCVLSHQVRISFRVVEGTNRGNYSIVFNTSDPTIGVDRRYTVSVAIAYFHNALFDSLKYREPLGERDGTNPWDAYIGKSIRRNRRNKTLALLGLLGLAFYAGFKFCQYNYGV